MPSIDIILTNDDCFDKLESATTEELSEISPELIWEGPEVDSPPLAKERCAAMEDESIGQPNRFLL